jgi:hypothetical protein
MSENFDHQLHRYVFLLNKEYTLMAGKCIPAVQLRGKNPRKSMALILGYEGRKSAKTIAGNPPVLG